MKYYQIANLAWRIKILIMMGVCIMVSVIGFYVFIKKPFAQKHQIELLLPQAQQQWQLLKNLHETSNTQLFKLLNNHLSADALMTRTTKLAEHIGLTILKLHPTHKNKLDGIYIEHLAISATGTFPQMMVFFQALLRWPYFIVLARWQLIQTNVMQIKLNLLIEVYHKN